MIDFVFYTIQVLIFISGAAFTLTKIEKDSLGLVGGMLFGVGIFMLNTRAQGAWSEVSFIILVIVVPLLTYKLNLNSRVLDIYVRMLFSLSIIASYIGVQDSNSKWLTQYLISLN